MWGSAGRGCTHRTLDPGPYWPDTGHAQTTWRTSPVVLLGEKGEATAEGSAINNEEIAGMATQVAKDMS